MQSVHFHVRMRVLSWPNPLRGLCFWSLVQICFAPHFLSAFSLGMKHEALRLLWLRSRRKTNRKRHCSFLVARVVHLPCTTLHARSIALHNHRTHAESCLPAMRHCFLFLGGLNRANYEPGSTATDLRSGCACRHEKWFLSWKQTALLYFAPSTRDDVADSRDDAPRICFAFRNLLRRSD